MATENVQVINTRIQLKYDSLANWYSNNPTLLDGELAIAYLVGGMAEIPGTHGKHPVMFKVGPGQFNDLPWASALAADVYKWAKTKAPTLNGKIIEFRNEDNEDPVHTINLSDFITGNELAVVLNSYYTKSQVEELIADSEKFSTDILTVNALGGITAGEDLDGLTVRAILNKLLYPYVAPVIDSATGNINGGTYEKGDIKTITSVTTKVTKKSETITKIELYNNSTQLAEKTGDDVKNGGTFTFSGLNVKVPTDGNQLTVKVTDAAGKSYTKNTASMTFVYPYYYGVCASGATIDEALVESLTKKIESKGNKSNWKFTCDNQCAVFAYPKAHGKLSKIIDPNNFDITASFAVSEVSITGLDGTAQTYYVYVNSPSTVTNFEIDFNY